MPDDVPRPGVDPEPASRRVPTRPLGLLRWFLGTARFLTLCLAFALVGLAGGLIVGARRALLDVAALPVVTKPTLGMESAGFTPAAIWLGSLLLHGALGLVLGLLAGLVIIPVVAVSNRMTRRPPRAGS